jgi:predicted  nucleic acid-binding Zn-ribbon protein
VEVLSKENEVLNTELLSQRDLQLALLQEIEALKQERAALVQKKVCSGCSLTVRMLTVSSYAEKPGYRDSPRCGRR